MDASTVLALPGRIRIKAGDIYRNDRLSNEVSYYLLEQTGIHYVEANQYTGKILIIFDPKRVSMGEVIKILRGFTLRDKSLASKDNKKSSLADLPWRSLIGGIGFLILLLKHQTTGASKLTKSPTILNMAALATAVSGYPVYRKGAEGLLNKKKLNSEMVLTGASLIFFFLRESTAGLLATFLLSDVTGSYMNKMTAGRKQIETLASRIGSFNVEQPSNSYISRSLSLLKPEDIVSLKQNEIVPLDGVIVEGRGIFISSRLDGHIAPEIKSVGHEVVGGSILSKGKVRISLTKDSRYENQKPEWLPTKKPNNKLDVPWQDRVLSHKITWYSVILSAFVLIITGDISQSLAMILVACPSGIEKSYPLATFNAVMASDHNGVIIKNEKTFLRTAQAKTVIFDKTGTLSLGDPKVIEVLELHHGVKKEDILRIAAIGEIASSHPFGLAIEKMARELQLDIEDNKATDIVEGDGGIKYRLEDKIVLVGNKQLLKENNILVKAKVKDLQGCYKKEGSCVYVAIDKELVGLIRLVDTLKPEAQSVIKHLKAEGRGRLHIASGDEDSCTRFAAKELGIKYSYGGLTPYDKERLVKRLRKREPVLVVGDGMNDIKALSAADCGIVFASKRGEVGLRCGDTVILGDDLRKLNQCLKLSEWTVRIGRENEFIALIGNIVGFFITAAGVLSPFHASLYHNANMIMLIANSYRLNLLSKKDYNFEYADIIEDVIMLISKWFRKEWSYGGAGKV